MPKTNYQEILQSQYNVYATSVTPFKSNVALVKLGGGEQAIFKRARTEKGASLVDKFRFRNEIRMYKFFQEENFTYLNVPKLFSAGKEHILIEYIEREEDENVSEGDFAKAYYEMQNIPVPPALFFDLFNQITRGVWYRGIVVPIVTLTKYSGIRKSIKAVGLFLKLQLQSKTLKKRYWLHGDLGVRNVYYHLKDRQLFFIDFENMYFTRKWPLLEIVQKCVCYGGYEKQAFSIDVTSLQKYLAQAEKHQNRELLNINIKQQFRLSLLFSTVSRIIRPKTKEKTIAFKTLLDVLLNDKAYQSWFQSYIEPLLKEFQTIK